MLKPNFIAIGWEINSGELADSQFTKNGENFYVFGPLDPPKYDFCKIDFNLHWPEVFSMLKPNFIGIGWELKSGQLTKPPIHEKRRKFRRFWTPGPPIMRFSQNGLQLALARGIFYAETKFHWHWLRDKLRTASQTLIYEKRRKFRSFWIPGPPKMRFSQNGLQFALAQGIS